MASIDHLHQESLTLKVKDHSDMFSGQYLVNCLEEDHLCHGITTQEPKPRPMKETLHSRHHSTVLPRLGTSRKESHQNMHTYVVDSEIQLQGNNSTEGASTHNIGRGAETESKTTMHSLTDVRCETPVRLHHTPEDLWRNPVGSIRAFCYLDNGNLD